MRAVAFFSLAFGASAFVTSVEAQQSQPEPQAPTPASEAVALPEITVETDAKPAKRNVRKQALKANPASVAPNQPAASAPLPGVVIEGEKVIRTQRDSTTSIGVVTGEQIRTEQIEDLQEALNSQANVLSSGSAGNNNGFTIRGLNSEGFTNNSNPQSAPLISVIIDGATQNAEASRRGARGLWDVEQVEVLRGPQSALQARNSLAGAVFIKTKDPTYKWEGIVEGTVGEQDLRSGGFVLNAPIVAGQSALRLSGQSFEREHDIRYGSPEDNVLDDDVLRTLRGKFLVEPDSLPGLSALFTVGRVEDTPADVTVSAPFEERFSAAGQNTDLRSTETMNYISDISFRVTPGVTLRSITAYADTETTIGSGPSALIQRDVLRDGGDFTQDLRVEIENTGNGLSGVAGLFYGSFESENDTFDSVNPASFLFPGAVIQDLVTDAKTESIAAYADLRYRFWDRFVVIGGGRLLRDEVESSTNGVVLPDFLGPIGELQGTFASDFTEFLPRAGITYDLTRDQTIGFTYNKGYRNGYSEFNLALQQFFTAKPEFLDAYELSYRSAWAGNTISFNANAFYYDYKDQQVAFDENIVLVPGVAEYPVSYTLNADNSHAYGAEFEARWRPITPLQLYGSLGLMRTEFDRFDALTNGDFSGNEFPEAPAYTIAAGALYKAPSGWFAGANVRHTDGYYSGGDLGNTALRFVDGYTLVDARVGYEWDKYTVTVFAKNLFDEEYVTSKTASVAPRATVGDEQLFGVTLRGQF